MGLTVSMLAGCGSNGAADNASAGNAADNSAADNTVAATEMCIRDRLKIPMMDFASITYLPEIKSKSYSYCVIALTNDFTLSIERCV